MENNIININDWLQSVKDKVHQAQTKASIKVNAEMLQLYFEIGRSILFAQDEKGWGAQVVDNLSKELKSHFPDSTGFSVRNLKYMRSFAKAYPDFPIVQVPLAQNKDEFMQVPLAQITWYHHIGLLTKVKDFNERAFYIAETAKLENLNLNIFQNLIFISRQLMILQKLRTTIIPLAYCFVPQKVM